MIVICTKCQAKFRVADEKIGPRGAKVRCSKCQTVFVVRPEGAAATAAPAASAAGAGLDLERPRSVPPPLPPPLPSARPAEPFAAFPPPAGAPLADPFAAAAAPDPFAPAAQPDPFAAAAAPDPFAPAAQPDPFAAAPDPFAPSSAPADPFAAPARPDPFAAPDPFVAPARSDPFAAPAAASGPVSAATDLGDLLAAAASAAPPPVPEPAAAPPADPSPAGGLALEERTSSPPRPASSAPFDVGSDAGFDAGFDAFAGGGEPQAFDPGALELGGPAAAPEPAVVAAAVPVSAPAPSSRPFLPAEPRPAPEPEPEPAAQGDAHERIPGRPSRLRSVAVNAVALAALLVAAAGILALWRTEGPIDAAALRPAAILAALRGSAADAAFATRDVRSGLYERERAPPLLFVRGTVVSRAAAPVGRVEIRVDVVRAGAVVATARAIAGAVPTPEELWAARDADALAAVAAAAARRAPAEVRPGDAVPFLVAIADQPADLSGASLRVEVAPAGSGRP